jgi:hypothetical protein
MSLRDEVLRVIQNETLSDETKADEIVKIAKDIFQPLDAEMYDS